MQPRISISLRNSTRGDCVKFARCDDIAVVDRDDCAVSGCQDALSVCSVVITKAGIRNKSMMKRTKN